jgi:hypothetical protein
MSNFQEAKEALDKMRSLNPCKIKGLELLSGAMWQLNLKNELAYLAQQVMASKHARGSPQVPCLYICTHVFIY